MNFKNKIIIFSFIAFIFGCSYTTLKKNEIEMGYTSQLGIVSRVYAPLPAGKTMDGYITFGEIIKIFARANPSLRWDAGMMTFVNQRTDKKISPVTNADQSIPVQEVGEWFIRWGS